MKRKTLYILLPIVLIALTFSCKKGSIETNYNPVLSVAKNQVIAERAYSEVFNIFFMVISDSTLKHTGSNVVYGAACTYTNTNGIKYTIDYHPYPTPCPDGKNRQGVITAILNKDFSEADAIATLSFSNFIVNELQLYGENTITNNSSSANAKYQHEVLNATLTLIDSLSYTPYHWSSSKTFTQLEGKATPDDFEDDVFSISGTSSGSDIGGVIFSAQIDESLGDHFSCRWIRTGRTVLSTPGQDIESGLIDYIGEDTCTNQVAYYFNGNLFYDKFLMH